MKLLRRLRALFRKEKLDAEMSEEMRVHLELLAAENEKRGMSADEAHAAARRAFGGFEQIKERARDQRGWVWLETLVSDFRFAVRSLAKSPGFTSVALLTLALGIGANTTAFSVFNALLLHTPPYAQPDTIVRLFHTSRNGLGGSHPPANFLDFRAENTVFAQLAAMSFGNFNLGAPGQPTDRLRGIYVTADFFPALGVAPKLGRTFTLNEEREGNNAVVILSESTWRQRFGGDPAIVGRTIRIDAAPVTVIGVMPATIDDPLLWGGDVAAWRPLALSDKMRADRDNTTLPVIGRLKPGVSIEQAQAAMDTIAARIAKAYPDTNSGRGLKLVVLGRSIGDTITHTINWTVIGLAGFVLMIGCANLANLQFARNSARGREHAVRLALGATRARLMRLVLAESALLAFAGGALGVLLAVWTNGFVGHTFDVGSGGLDVALDRRVLAFTFFVCVLTGLGFGLLPAWLASRANVGDALKQGGRGSTSGRSQHRIRRVLIVAEVALALLLLAGASFFVRGLQRFAQRDPGWNPSHLLTADVSLRGQKYAATSAREEFYRRLQERLAALSGVDHVAIATSLPAFGFNNSNSFVVEGRPEPPAGTKLDARVSAVTPHYFETLGIRLLQGRDFTAADDSTKPLVVVINESMARQLWPGENPIGKRIGGATPFMSNPREIIGVVSDTRSVANFDNVEGRFQFYRALSQWGQNTVTIALRTQHAPEALAPDLRRAVAELDPDQAIFRIETMEQTIEHNLGSIAGAADALVIFAILGVMLASVGIYGVIAHSVAERTNEIGIRMALGAQVRDVLALILGGGLRLTLLGTSLGLIGAVGIARFLKGISPEFSVIDFGLTGGLTLVLIAVATFASWLPARRATKVDPIIALRCE